MPKSKQPVSLFQVINVGTNKKNDKEKYAHFNVYTVEDGKLLPTGIVFSAEDFIKYEGGVLTIYESYDGSDKPKKTVRGTDKVKKHVPLAPSEINSAVQNRVIVTYTSGHEL